MPSSPSSSRRPTRGLAVLLAVVALVVAVTGCGSAGAPPAATVDGTEISADRVDEVLDAFVEADPETYQDQVEGQGQDTLAMGAVSGLLGNLVVQVIQSELAQQRDIVPTDEERTQATEEVRTSFVAEETPSTQATDGPTESEKASAAIYDALSTDTQTWLVDLRADALALSRTLGAETDAGDAAARQFYDQNPLQFTAVCLRLLVVAEGDLAAAQARLDAGEDFAAVSAEISTDPQVAASVQGDPQCTALSQLQQSLQPEAFQSLAQAAEGDVVGPFQYDDQGNVVLVEVQRTQLTPFDQVRDAIIGQLPAAGDQAVADLVREAATTFDISVDPRFGSWDAEQGTVVPPAGPTVPPASTSEGGAPVDPSAATTAPVAPPG